MSSASNNLPDTGDVGKFQIGDSIEYRDDSKLGSLVLQVH